MKNLIAVLMCVALAAMVGCSTMDEVGYGNKLVWTDLIEVPVDEIVIPEKVHTVKIKEAVMFDFDKSVIRDDQTFKIDKVAEAMAKYPDTVLIIDGFASSEGPENYNLTLSTKRAVAVKAALIEKGVAEDRIKAVTGRGETGIFGELFNLNRRVLVLSID